MTTYYTTIGSPVGPLLLTSDGSALTGVSMTDQRHGPAIGADSIEDRSVSPLVEAARQLCEYFEGRRTEFSLPLAEAGTDFQRRVWLELTRIPYGETISYGELARRIGNPKAMRAVGLANGRNPWGIVVPCHRVIGADGSLTGYGGGLERKQILLSLERARRG
jgi:methylated-DNA-[protein]-cysteine S-methyltransferase